MKNNSRRVLDAIDRVAAERRTRVVPGTIAGARAAERRDTVHFVRRAIARQRARARPPAAR